MNATATGAVLKLPEMEHVWLCRVFESYFVVLYCLVNIFIGYNDSEGSAWEYESSLTLLHLITPGTDSTQRAHMSNLELWVVWSFNCPSLEGFQHRGLIVCK